MLALADEQLQNDYLFLGWFEHKLLVNFERFELRSIAWMPSIE